MKKDKKNSYDYQNYILQKNDNKALEIIKNLSDPGSVVDDTKRSLLHYAAEGGYEQVTKYLIEENANVNAQDSQGKTPLALATTSRFGYRNIDLLLRANADILLCDKDGKSPLQLAVEFGCQKILQKFSEEFSGNIEKLAEKLRDFQCSVYTGLLLKNPQLTKLLLAHGCPLESHVPSRDNTIARAIRLEDYENLKILLDHEDVDVNAENAYGDTALLKYELECKDTDTSLKILQLLLDRGANPLQIINRHRKLKGKMQMCAILKFCKRESVKVLLDSNVDLYAKDQNGCTAIHYMAGNEWPGVIQELRGRKYNVNIRNNNGETPLHHVNESNLTAAKFLLAEGGDINARDVHGFTPLCNPWRKFYSNLSSYSIYNWENFKRTVECFLCAGADPEAHVRTTNGLDVSISHIVINLSSDYLECHWAQPMLAHLALVEARGTPIERILRKQINKYESFKEYYELCQRQLQLIKSIDVWKFVNLHELLVANDSKIERYARNENLLLNLNKMKNKNNYLPYYTYVLRYRVNRAIRVNRMRMKVSGMIFEMIGKRFKLCHVVVDEIIKYLNEFDLRKLCWDG